jgi:hypothetical protein
MVFRINLLCNPAHDFSELYRYFIYFSACQLCKYNTLAVSLYKMNWDIEFEQTCQCFTWHRTRNHIAPDDNVIYLSFANLLEHSF